MKVFVLYRDRSDHARMVTTFAHDFEEQTNKKLELIDMDSREGAEKAELYGVMSFPAVIAVKEDGEMLKMWSEPMLPRVGEVSAYSD